MILFFGLPILIFVYLAVRLVSTLTIGRGKKIVAIVILGLLSMQHLAISQLIGFSAAQELHPFFLAAQGWGLCFTIILTLFTILRDIWLSAMKITRKLSAKVTPSQTENKSNRQAVFTSNPLHALLFCICAALISGWGLWQALRIPDVRSIEIALPNLPHELDGFRIVQLSDLHISKLAQAPKVQVIVDKTNALDGDIIVLTGDMIDGLPEQRAADVAPLGGLAARYGVFGIPGNHEYFHNYLGWMQKFRSLGIQLFLNEHTILHHNGQPLVLAGITDPAAQRFGQPLPNPEKALRGAPQATTILLAHQPKTAPANAMHPVDLQLSGHTHGGQMPGIHLIAKYLNNGFLAGVYEVERMKLYVSKGTCQWSGFPIRIATPSEITLITLRSTKCEAPSIEGAFFGHHS